MPKKTANDKKLEKAEFICRMSAKKYKYGPKQEKKCVRAVAKNVGYKKKKKKS